MTRRLTKLVHSIQDGKIIIEGDLRREIGMKPQAIAGHQFVSRHPALARPAGARAAHPDQRAHPQGSRRRWVSSAVRPPRRHPLMSINFYHSTTNPFTSTWLTKPKRNPLPRRKLNPGPRPEAPAAEAADKPAGSRAKSGGDSHSAKGPEESRGSGRRRRRARC